MFTKACVANEMVMEKIYHGVKMKVHVKSKKVFLIHNVILPALVMHNVILPALASAALGFSSCICRARTRESLQPAWVPLLTESPLESLVAQP